MFVLDQCRSRGGNVSGLLNIKPVFSAPPGTGVGRELRLLRQRCQPHQTPGLEAQVQGEQGEREQEGGEAPSCFHLSVESTASESHRKERVNFEPGM